MFNYKILKDEIDNLKSDGLYVNIRTLESPQGSHITVNGKKVLNLCSNNYLGFANDDRLKQASKKAIEEWGVGPGAVRTIAGTMKIHEELEKTLAEFKGADATIFLQSGFIANQAAIPTIFGDENDAIISDELNHASIIDGVRLSKAKRYVYKHNDMNELEARLKEAKDIQKARRILIITDGVFSMDGDIAPLPDIVELAEKYEAAVMVDDAHGEGVLGRGGRGIVDHYELHGRVDMEIGTLSKAFGVLGGYIAGKDTLIEYLKQKARPFLFSTGLTPADVAACLEAVKILQESDERVKKLWNNANYFKSEMKKLGFDLGVSQTPISPVMLYDAKISSQFSRELFEEGIFAQSIGYPTVPKGKARIRVMISAVHSKENLDFALEKFEKVGKKLGVI